MRVIQKEARLWQVVELGEVLAEFSTSEAAWKWVDWHSDEGLDAEERRRRIDTAFS